MNPRSFNNVVKKTFATGNKFAPHGIYLAFEKIKELGQSEKGRDELYSRMRLCSKLQTERDVDLVIDYYENAISYMAMADYPYPASFLGPMPAFPAAYAGKFFPQEDPQNSNSETLIDSMVQGIANVFYNFSGQSGSCFDVRQENPPGLEGDSWDIQCCREIIEPIGSYGWPNDVFLKNPFDIESTVQQCESKYSGTVPRKNFVIQHFGGSNLDGASRIFFSNGDLDPWISGGITRNFSVHKDVIAYVIKNGAHHLDLRFSHPDDPESVIIARNMERAAIRRWIKKYWRENDKFEQTIA
jgi:lysosomal Pro-X carboxypeptidase